MAYRLRVDTESLDLPKTVQALIAGRIDRLEPADKKLLSAASVIGHEIPYPLLLAVTGQPEPMLATSLSRLKSGELIYEKQLFPETLYAFKHSLIHDVTLRSLLKVQRRRLHARVGEAMERIYPTRQIELAESIAWHFAEGASWPKAMQSYLLAAEISKAQYALDHAMDLCHRGLACAEQVAGQMEFEPQLLVLRGDLWSQYGDVEKANEAYERALLAADDPSARREIENKIHRQAFAARENGRVAFYKHGPKGKTIVFSSPISYSNGAWQLLIARLCQEFQVVTIDSRGVGASSPLAPGWTLEEDLEDVRAVIEALDDGSVTVVGLSHTGAMAVRLAALYPRLVERVVVIGGSFGKAEAGGDTSGYLDWAAETRAIIDRGDYEGAVRKVLYEALPQPEMRDLREIWAKDHAEHTPIDVFCATILDVESEMACEPYAKDVSVPTLVVHGTEDLSVPYAHGVYLASTIPGAILYPFQGHGHEPQISATTEFCDVLRKFVRTGSVTEQKATTRNAV